MRTDIYVIIVTYNGMTWLERCLQSIPSQYSIIIVDNGSTDSTVDYVRSNHSRVLLLEQLDNLGFGKANNIGMAYAYEKGCSAVFLLNQDAYLSFDTISVLESFHQAHSEYGILSPLHFAGDHYHLDRNFKKHLLQSSNSDFLSDAYHNDLNEVYDVLFVNAAAWYVPRETLEKIGGFDPIFKHYGEDDNYCQRVCYHKLSIGICSQARVIHDRNQDHKPVPNDYSPQHYEYIERVLKVRLADLNNDLTKPKLDGLFKQKKKELLKARLRLNTKWISRRKKELKLLKKVMPAIKLSRAINSAIGPHYITSRDANLKL